MIQYAICPAPCWRPCQPRRLARCIGISMHMMNTASRHQCYYTRVIIQQMERELLLGSCGGACVMGLLAGMHVAPWCCCCSAPPDMTPAMSQSGQRADWVRHAACGARHAATPVCTRWPAAGGVVVFVAPYLPAQAAAARAVCTAARVVPRAFQRYQIRGGKHLTARQDPGSKQGHPCVSKGTTGPPTPVPISPTWARAWQPHTHTPVPSFMSFRWMHTSQFRAASPAQQHPLIGT